MPVYLTGTDNPDVLRAKKSGWGTYWRRWHIVGKDGDDTIYGGGDWDGDWLYGNEGEDTIYGYRGRDYIDGGEGADKMYGGDDSDTFIVNDSGDIVIEQFDEGNRDTVHSHIQSYVLPANVENLKLEGNAVEGYGNNLNNWIEGNSLDNTLSGGDGSDSLYGYDGNDTLFSISGGSHMYGGAGDDTYYLLPGGNGYVHEYDVNEGHDTVMSGLQSYKLSGAVEDLILLEYSTALNGTGNGFDNTIVGNSNNNFLAGDDGDDLVLGKAGNDVLVGGLGSDMLYGNEDADTLVGIGTLERNSEEYDHMWGGSGADSFQLGWTSSSATQVHYLGLGYAYLEDFSRQEGDKIQAGGNPEAYELTHGNFSGVGSANIEDTRIKYEGDLIGFVVDNTTVTVATDFVF